MRQLVRAALAGAIAAAVVVAAAWALGIPRHDLRVFLLGQITGATLSAASSAAVN